jgi:long-chain acyl-CoA synthetase
MVAYDDKPWINHYDPWVTPEINIPDKTYADLLNDSFHLFPDRPALYFFGRMMTFRQLDRMSNRFADFLIQHGCGPGDVVGIHLPNIPQYLIALAGSLRAGCAVSGMSFLLTPKEMAYQINDSGMKVLVVMDSIFEDRLLKISDQCPRLKNIVAANVGDYLPAVKRFLGRLLKKIPSGRISKISGKKVSLFTDILLQHQDKISKSPINPDDVCLIQYTGGTTGVPKGTLLTHRNIVANITQAKQWIDFKMDQHETGLSAFPFFHLAGLMLGLMALSSAATQCLIPDPRDTKLICNMIRKYKPTMLANVPTLYQMLLAEPMFKQLDFSRCKVCISGAAPFSEGSIRELESIVGKGKVLEVYGMTETSPLLTMNPYQGKKKIGTVGIPIQGVSIKLVDLETGSKEVSAGEEGEIIARGPQVMAGYKDKPAETNYALREFNGEKWLYTGDVAVMDNEGYFKIVDRTKDMVNVGGYKVFSREVEEVLYQHPAVAFCAIVGQPNPERPGSELVRAVIQPKSDGAKFDKDALAKDIIEFCRSRMAPYKVPKIIELVESMPLTSVGKVDKKALRKN